MTCCRIDIRRGRGFTSGAVHAAGLQRARARLCVCVCARACTSACLSVESLHGDAWKGKYLYDGSHRCRLCFLSFATRQSWLKLSSRCDNSSDSFLPYHWRQDVLHGLGCSCSQQGQQCENMHARMHKQSIAILPTYPPSATLACVHPPYDLSGITQALQVVTKSGITQGLQVVTKSCSFSHHPPGMCMGHCKMGIMQAGNTRVYGAVNWSATRGMQAAS